MSLTASLTTVRNVTTHFGLRIAIMLLGCRYRDPETRDVVTAVQYSTLFSFGINSVVVILSSVVTNRWQQYDDFAR
jgi:ABC-type Mn2+/Zn2+ transport system permease subunit